MKKRLLIGLAAAGVIGGGVYGFAATLGGLDSTSLGADNQNVVSCDTDGIDAAYTVAYTTAGYAVDSVQLTDINAACAGKVLQITLSDSADGSLDEQTITLTNAAAQNAEFDSDVLAEDVYGVDIVVEG